MGLSKYTPGCTGGTCGIADTWAALGYIWEGTCANTHLDVLGPHVASMAPLAPLGPPGHADVYIYMWLGTTREPNRGASQPPSQSQQPQQPQQIGWTTCGCAHNSHNSHSSHSSHSTARCVFAQVHSQSSLGQHRTAQGSPEQPRGAQGSPEPQIEQKKMFFKTTLGRSG